MGLESTKSCSAVEMEVDMQSSGYLKNLDSCGVATSINQTETQSTRDMKHHLMTVLESNADL